MQNKYKHAHTCKNQTARAIYNIHNHTESLAPSLDAQEIPIHSQKCAKGQRIFAGFMCALYLVVIVSYRITIPYRSKIRSRVVLSRIANFARVGSQIGYDCIDAISTCIERHGAIRKLGQEYFVKWMNILFKSFTMISWLLTEMLSSNNEKCVWRMARTRCGSLLVRTSTTW